MTTVCLGANTLGYTEGGGHLWAYLNWALAFRSLGVDVIWLELAHPKIGSRLSAEIKRLKSALLQYGLHDRVVVCGPTKDRIPETETMGCLSVREALTCDALVNLNYRISDEVVGAFRRSVLIDIDPGLLQVWIAEGSLSVARHSRYVTTGEGVVGSRRIPSCGLDWKYVSPAVALDWWPLFPSRPEAPFSTVTHWYANEWFGTAEEGFRNDKASGFAPFLDLPRYARPRLELATYLGQDEDDVADDLKKRGWGIRRTAEVARTPARYQSYIRESGGEFSCAKPSCVHLKNSWVSDRTLCYLATGRPAVVQWTGDSEILPDRGGIYRFRSFDDAIEMLEEAASDLTASGMAARRLAERYFNGASSASRILESVL